MEYDLLNEINTSKEEWSTRVRVCRLWESKNFKNNNEVISLDMVLMDAKGNMMHATVRKGLMSKFKHLLQEGRVYGIKDFKVVPTNGHYQPITGDFKIFFMNCTSVTRKEDEDPEIATYGFQFVDWATMQSRLNKNSVLTDVMGCLSAIGGIEIVGVDKKKRELEIITQDDINSYNLKEGMENYTISKVYKPDEEVEYESIDKKLKNTIPNECISKEEVDVATNDDKGLIMKRKCVIDDPDEEKMHVKKRPLSARKRKLKVFDLEG